MRVSSTTDPSTSRSPGTKPRAKGGESMQGDVLTVAGVRRHPSDIYRRASPWRGSSSLLPTCCRRSSRSAASSKQQTVSTQAWARRLVVSPRRPSTSKRGSPREEPSGEHALCRKSSDAALDVISDCLVDLSLTSSQSANAQAFSTPFVPASDPSVRRITIRLAKGGHFEEDEWLEQVLPDCLLEEGWLALLSAWQRQRSYGEVCHCASSPQAEAPIGLALGPPITQLRPAGSSCVDHEAHGVWARRFVRHLLDGRGGPAELLRSAGRRSCKHSATLGA